MHGFFFIHGKDFWGEMWVSFLNKGYLLQSNIKPNHFVLQSLSRKITQTISPNKFAKAIKTEKKSRDLQYRAFLAATWLIDCESRGIFMRRRSLWWLSSSPQKYFPPQKSRNGLKSYMISVIRKPTNVNIKFLPIFYSKGLWETNAAENATCMKERELGQISCSTFLAANNRQVSM